MTNFSELGFTEAPKEIPKRLIVSVESEQKNGKTHFALTSPEPIYYVSIDTGEEGVIEKFADKEIYVKKVSMPNILLDEPTQNKTAYSEVWEDLRTTLDKIWKQGKGTLVLDTASEAWEIARLAHFGKLTQVMPHNHVEVNTQWRELIRHAYETPMNTVLLHKLRPSFNNAAVLEMKGFGETSFLTQVHVRLTRENPDNFSLEIRDCRHNPKLNGTILTPKELVNFDMLMGMVHG